jgi:hypothetical protein
MTFLYSHAREPWVPVESFPAETLAPERTPLAVALAAHGLTYRTWDFTRDEYRLAQLRLQVLPELKPRFEEEGILFIYENRVSDAKGISQAVEEGLQRRYLYLVQA